VDGSGNVYIADTYNNAIRQWDATTQTVSTLVSAGLSYPDGVAVDGSGNVYIADSGNSAIKQWNAATQTVGTLISSGLNGPWEVAVDGSGNVYIADSGNSAIKQWSAATQTVSTLVSPGLLDPSGVAVDGSGNVYIADTYNNVIRELPRAFVDPTAKVESLAASGDALPAVLPAGENLLAPFAPVSDSAWLSLGVISNGVVNFSFTANNTGTVVRGGHITLLGQSVTVTQGSPPVVTASTASLAGNAQTVTISGTGFDPVAANNTAVFSNGATGTVTAATATSLTVTFTVDPTSAGSLTAVVTIGGASSGRPVQVASVQSALGTYALVEGPGSGTGSVVLSTAGTGTAWTAAANAAWLHMAAGSTSGTDGANVIFTFDANTGPTRTGNLTIAGQTLSVTQAASAYVAANPLTTLVSSGLSGPAGVAVDGAGNVYIADTYNNAIEQWSTATQTVSTLISSGLKGPWEVAVDSSGNVYIADTTNSAIKLWSAATQTVSTLVSSGLSYPQGVAVDGSGNVYIADTGNNAIRLWNAATQTVSTLVSSGLNSPGGVAVDGAGNVYIADTYNNAIKQWSAATQTVSTLISFGLNQPQGLAVDGSGNVYIADSGNYAIKQWNAATQAVSTLVSSGLFYPQGVAVDGSGNVYIADSGNSAIRELPRAFVDPTPKSESLAAGSDTLQVILPASENLLAPFAPASDSAWLSIGTISNGVVNFSFTANNTGTTRNGHIAVLGQSVPVTQGPVITASTASLAGNAQTVTISGTGFDPVAANNTVVFSNGATGTVTAATATSLTVTFTVDPASAGSLAAVVTNNGTSSGSPVQVATVLGILVEGSGAGADSVLLSTAGAGTAWTATANAAWLHMAAGSTSGTGGANVIFTFDANSGLTRTGTLTIAGQTIRVIQAASTYVAANPLATLVSSGLSYSSAVAVDGSGNVYIADSGNNAIRQWNAATQTVSTLVSSGLSYPSGVAVDGSGNVYIADTYNSAIKQWNAATQTVSTLVSSGLSYPHGVAVDGSGNVYIADTSNNAVKQWNAATQTVSTLVSSGVNLPLGVAVDSSGNVYIADTGNSAIKQWNAATQTLSTLVSSGLSYPDGVAVDGSGNVYIADTGNSVIEQWSAATQTMSTLACPGLSYPQGVAVDGSGNLYIADTSNSAIRELPRAFVDPTARSESATAGSDALPTVLPANENLLPPFAPVSDSAWLNIGAIFNGVVNFSFTANTTGTTRTGNITLLGQSVAITQPPLPPVQSWRQTWYGTPGNSGNAADTAAPWGNGIANLAVFAFLGPSQNPATAQVSQLPKPAMMSGGNYGFSFTQPAGVTGVTYSAQYTTSLNPANWQPIPDTGSGTQHIFSVPIGADSQLFLRLLVTETE
jgi:DNA-binding beta-propeller fold protein YncE